MALWWKRIAVLAVAGSLGGLAAWNYQLYTVNQRQTERLADMRTRVADLEHESHSVAELRQKMTNDVRAALAQLGGSIPDRLSDLESRVDDIEGSGFPVRSRSLGEVDSDLDALEAEVAVVYTRINSLSSCINGSLGTLARRVVNHDHGPFGNFGGLTYSTC